MPTILATSGARNPCSSTNVTPLKLRTRRSAYLRRGRVSTIAAGSAGAGGALLEVLGPYVLQKLPELLDLLLLLLVLTDDDAGLAEHLLVGEDRHPQSHGQSDGVGRAGRDLERRPVLAHLDDRVEGPVPELGDQDPIHPDAELLEHVLHQVVRHRPGRFHPLEGEGDRRGLRGTDPDRQVPLPLALLEENDGLVPGQLDPDADQVHLDHRPEPNVSPTPETGNRTTMRIVGPIPPEAERAPSDPPSARPCRRRR